MVLLELSEDGVFILRMEGGAELRGRIMAVATADDVIKASNLGQSFVAARIFLPEAVEEAKRRNVKLVNIEDVAEPLASLMINLLASRRADLLIRVFNLLIPPQLAKSYSYSEYRDVMIGEVEDVSFRVRIEIPGKFAANVFEDLSELLNELVSKMGRIEGVDVEFTIKKEGSDRVIDYGFSTEATE